MSTYQKEHLVPDGVSVAFQLGYEGEELALAVAPALTRYEHAGLLIDVPAHRVSRDGTPVHLTPTEFKLLAMLIERRGRVQTRDRLLVDVWGYEGDVDTRTVDTHVRRLREKLGKVADWIETIRGVGYRFIE